MRSRAVILRRFPTIRRQNNCWFHIDLRGRIGVLWLFLLSRTQRGRGEEKNLRRKRKISQNSLFQKSCETLDNVNYALRRLLQPLG